MWFVWDVQILRFLRGSLLCGVVNSKWIQEVAFLPLIFSVLLDSSEFWDLNKNALKKRGTQKAFPKVQLGNALIVRSIVNPKDNQEPGGAHYYYRVNREGTKIYRERGGKTFNMVRQSRIPKSTSIEIIWFTKGGYWMRERERKKEREGDKSKERKRERAFLSR